MNAEKQAYLNREHGKTRRYLEDNLVMPWFVRQLIPAPDQERSPFSMGRSSSLSSDDMTVSPMVAVAARQFCATRGALCGAPDEVTASVVTPKSAVPWIAHILSGLEPADRRYVFSAALRQAEGPRRPIVPFFACIPDDATQPQASALIDGLGTLMLAVGAAGATDSMSTVAARAASIASRQPFASDPHTVAGPNDVALAKMLLDAYMAEPELRDEIFHSRPFREALEQVSVEAAGESMAAVIADGVASEAAMSPSEIELQKEIYSCIQHEMPLGGDPLYGGRLGDWLKKAAGKVKDFVSKVDSAAQDQYRTDRQASWREQISKARPEMSVQEVDEEASRRADQDTASKFGPGRTRYEKGGGVFDRRVGGDVVPPTDQTASDHASEALDSAVSESKQLIDDAMSKLAETRGNLAAQQDKLRSDARDYARLLWASEILAASDDVAEILAGVKLNASDPSAFITSAMSVLPAAKASGNLTTIKALANALRAAASKSGVNEGSILAMLTGDPDSLADEGAVATPQVVAANISAKVRTSWGMPCTDVPESDTLSEGTDAGEDADIAPTSDDDSDSEPELGPANPTDAVVDDLQEPNVTATVDGDESVLNVGAVPVE